jgi:hypothetical protein
MYGPERLKLFLPVAKEGRGRGSDAERPLGIGELRQVIQSDFSRGDQEMGFRVWLAKEGCLKYSTFRTDLQ